MGTVSKALVLLEYFSRQRPQIGLSDFARLSGMNKATCHRLLTELAEFGFVEQIGGGREYRLGPQVLRLAALREAAVPRRDAAMPVLHALAKATGETVHLSVIAGEKLQMLGYAYSGAHAMAVMMDDTDTLPFHATSSGLAVLGFGPLALRDRVLAQALPALTSLTETDPAALRARMAAVRAKGIAESVGGFEVDVSSLAAPLFDAAGQCCGALAVAAPAQRMTADLHQMIREKITRAAMQITGLWGGTLPPDVQILWQGMAQDRPAPIHERAIE